MFHLRIDQNPILLAKSSYIVVIIYNTQTKLKFSKEKIIKNIFANSK